MSGEPFETRPEAPNRSNGRSTSTAILLIAAGVILLLINLGAIGRHDIAQLVRLWPLVLVYLGLKQILSRPSGA
jgi:hypothetical protein